ncbi:MAG: hypothetical protein ACPGLV_01335 [Bacteroidia bacterium]
MRILVFALFGICFGFGLFAQGPLFNNFYTAATYTNPSFATAIEAPTASFSYINNNNFWKSSLWQVVQPVKQGGIYGSYSRFGAVVSSSSIFFHDLNLGYAHKIDIGDLIISGGLGMAMSMTQFKRVAPGIADTTQWSSFINSNLGFNLKYKGVQFGFSSRRIHLLHVSPYVIKRKLSLTQNFNISFIHRIRLSDAFSLNYASIFTRSGGFNRIDNYLRLRVKRLEIGGGFQNNLPANDLAESNVFPSYYLAYSFKRYRVNYNCINMKAIGRWRVHEIGLQFAFNTKGKEVNFLPF